MTDISCRLISRHLMSHRSRIGSPRSCTCGSGGGWWGRDDVNRARAVQKRPGRRPAAGGRQGAELYLREGPGLVGER